MMFALAWLLLPELPACRVPAAHRPGRLTGLGYGRTTTQAFTVAGDNFEPAIATSGQTLAGVVGPLIEAPVRVALVYLSLALRAASPGAPRPSKVPWCLHCPCPAPTTFPKRCSGAYTTPNAPRWPPRRRTRAGPLSRGGAHQPRCGGGDDPEGGLDLSKAFPKPLTDEAVRTADVVITTGCGDACPWRPGIGNQ
ncbi:hypothetical protein ACFVH6_05245 [Spirillospora sp. NPDC127200]